ncbi:MAG: F0F1 ATP synthase subunit gamma, partial [Caulobacteraceae bacterium]
MSGLNDVKNRIKSVKSIKQITKAMNLVATIKYKKARESAEHIRHFMDELKGTVENMYNFRLESVQSAYTEVREVKKTLAVIICS